MTYKWIPQSSQDYILNQISGSDEISICSAIPASWFQATRGSLWMPNAVITIGNVYHPPTDNGFVYECTVGGTTGNSQPVWGTINNGTFSDNSVTWKTHVNYSIINSPLVSGNFSISTGGSGERILTMDQLSGIAIHYSGNALYSVFLNSTDKTIRYITNASSFSSLTSGGFVAINSLTITVPEPI